MVKWEYIEAFVMKKSGIYPMTLTIPQEYAGPFGLHGPFYTLKDLGDAGWNLVVVITNLDEDETRIIFKRPNA